MTRTTTYLPPADVTISIGTEGHYTLVIDAEPGTYEMEFTPPNAGVPTQVQLQSQTTQSANPVLLIIMLLVTLLSTTLFWRKMS